MLTRKRQISGILSGCPLSLRSQPVQSVRASSVGLPCGSARPTWSGCRNTAAVPRTQTRPLATDAVVSASARRRRSTRLARLARRPASGPKRLLAPV